MAKVRPPLVSIAYVVDLCRGVAETLPTQNSPETRSAHVTRMLFMVAAHESMGFRCRRQLGFSKESPRGAVSFWQLEWPGIELSLGNLQTRPLLEVQAGIWMAKHKLPAEWLSIDKRAEIWAALQEARGDALGALFARLHHKWFTAQVPPNVYEMAKYCKQYHNTYRGKAKVEEYVNAFMKYWPLPLEEGPAKPGLHARAIPGGVP